MRRRLCLEQSEGEKPGDGTAHAGPGSPLEDLVVYVGALEDCEQRWGGCLWVPSGCRVGGWLVGE